jgi:hypothetical protein
MGALEKTVELVPEDPGARFRMALALARRGSPESREPAARRRGFLEKALESLDRAQKLGAEEASCLHLGSSIREWLGRSEEDRSILAEFVNRMTALDETGLAVVGRLLRNQAVARANLDFQQTLNRVKALLPESSEKRQGVAEALLEIVQDLFPIASDLAVRCGKLAAACRPDDARIAGIVDQWKAAAENPQQTPRPSPQGRRPGRASRILIVAVAILIIKGCFSLFRNADIGPARSSKYERPAYEWPQGSDRAPSTRFPPGRRVAPLLPDVKATPVGQKR